jgi:AmiR/NasT family two-component response regulator
VSVRQLEHALAARVRIEQAIGVLAERWRSTPREAFERLRKVARSLGRRVHDLGGDVIASITDPAVTLPDELVPPGR